MVYIDVYGFNVGNYIDLVKSDEVVWLITRGLPGTPYAMARVCTKGLLQQTVLQGGVLRKFIRVTAPTIEVANEVAARVGLLEILPLEIVVDPTVGTVVSLAEFRQRQHA